MLVEQPVAELSEPRRGSGALGSDTCYEAGHVSFGLELGRRLSWAESSGTPQGVEGVEVHGPQRRPGEGQQGLEGGSGVVAGCEADLSSRPVEVAVAGGTRRG